MQANDQYADAVRLLYGSHGYFASVIISFVVAVGAVVWGIYTADIPPAARNLGSMATFFLISTTFTLAKTIRDSFVADLGIPGHQIIRGTVGWRLQCWAFFIVAFYHSFFSVHSLDILYETKYFIYTGLLFTLNAAINLAKQTRDREDAKFWEAEESSIANLRKVSLHAVCVLVRMRITTRAMRLHRPVAGPTPCGRHIGPHCTNLRCVSVSAVRIFEWYNDL